jgi:hypothetical protein
LLSLASQNLTWWKALAELVDNSFDAGATRVVIRNDSKRRAVIVEDDGHGVKDVLALVTLGYHDPQYTNALGMYGIGAKDAWLFTGGEIEVDTVRSGTRCRLCFDGRDAQNWQCVDPVYEPSDLPSGTTITLPLHGRQQPKSEAFDRLAFVFSPALSRGLQIVRVADNKTKQPLTPCELPPLSETSRATFDIDGKQVEIEIGIVPENTKMRFGPFWLQYGHRIIDSTSIGAEGYSVARLGGRITLGKGWKLTKNKDDLGELKERLSEAIATRIKPLLEQAQKLSESIESMKMRTELENILNEAIKRKKREKRSKVEESQHGAILPRNTGRTRSSAANFHPDKDGSVRDVAKKRGFTLDYYEDDEQVLGQFDYNGTRVRLNNSHPFVAFAKSTSNRVALLSAAWALIANYAVRHQGQHTLLKFEWEDFAQAFAGLSSAYGQGVSADVAKAAG